MALEKGGWRAHKGAGILKISYRSFRHYGMKHNI